MPLIMKVCGQGTPSSSQTNQQCSACGTCTGIQGGPGSAQPRSPPYRSCTPLPGHPRQGSPSPWLQMEACGLPVEDVAAADPVARMMPGARQSVSNSPRCMPGCELGAPQEAARDSVGEIDVCIRGRNHPHPVQVRGAGGPRDWKMNDVVGLCRWLRELGGVGNLVRSRTVAGHLHPRSVVPDELRDSGLDPARFVSVHNVLRKVIGEN